MHLSICLIELPTAPLLQCFYLGPCCCCIFQTLASASTPLRAVQHAGIPFIAPVTILQQQLQQRQQPATASTKTVSRKATKQGQQEQPQPGRDMERMQRVRAGDNVTTCVLPYVCTVSACVCVCALMCKQRATARLRLWTCSLRVFAGV